MKVIKPTGKQSKQFKRAEFERKLGKSVKSSLPFSVRLEGDSMTPEFIESDVVIFDPSRLPKDGEAALVKTKDGRVFFKWVFRTRTGWRLCSENRAYMPFEIADIDVQFAYPATESVRVPQARKMEAFL